MIKILHSGDWHIGRYNGPEKDGENARYLDICACLDELGKGKIFVLPIENLSMIREINLVYPKDFEHPDILREIEKSYDEVRSRMRNKEHTLI